MSMIKSSAALRAFAARAVEAGVVAIDTKFVTRDTYYPSWAWFSWAWRRTMWFWLTLSLSETCRR